MTDIADKHLLRRYRVPQGRGFKLDRIDPQETHVFRKHTKDQKELARQLAASDTTRLDELQYKLYAGAAHAVLIVLQGLDTAGKDGTIRHVMGPLNPQGVRVAAFKKPTSQEASYDYLWRVHQVVPAKGTITVFNRSHYEDILVPTVLRTHPPDVIARRYREINAFEQYLAANQVTILKFFLHISRDEQKQRLEARLQDPGKQWKFQPQDLQTRRRWSATVAAYEGVLVRCNKPWAPWYVIPADRKWYRNFLVGRIVRLSLESLDLHFPAPTVDTSRIVIED